MSLAHQLRNPLAVMIGFADLLNQGLPEDQIGTAVEKILKNGIRCKQIVEGLFDFGQGLPDERKSLNINDIIRQRIQPMYAASLSGRLRWDLSDSLPSVECAEHPMAQVIGSILDNALRVAQTTVKVATYCQDGAVCISVTDDGPGIPPENRARLFEPFFTTWKDEGSIGLGLSLSKSVVKEHGGRLELDESCEEGTRFIVFLPAILNPLPVSAGRKIVQSAKAKARVLVVEDEPDLSDVLTTTLRMRGFEVDAALTATQAISFMENNHYDLAVLDILLPGDIGGRELFQIMQGSNPELAARVMFMTADTVNYETRRFLEQAGRPFLEKPFMVDEFAGRITAILKEMPPNP
jgi:CheY-like chemotaxis protein